MIAQYTTILTLPNGFFMDNLFIEIGPLYFVTTFLIIWQRDSKQRLIKWTLMGWSMSLYVHPKLGVFLGKSYGWNHDKRN
jgi:hypothetical protein